MLAAGRWRCQWPASQIRALLRTAACTAPPRPARLSVPAASAAVARMQDSRRIAHARSARGGPPLDPSWVEACTLTQFELTSDLRHFCSSELSGFKSSYAYLDCRDAAG